MDWLLLVTNLTGSNQALRIRIWRALRAGGAAALRDGVYLLPSSASGEALFESHKTELERAKGSAQVIAFRGSSGQDVDFQRLFDRTKDYRAFIKSCADLKRDAVKSTLAVVQRQVSQLRRELAALVVVDFFDGEARRQAEAALIELDESVARAFGQAEPHASKTAIKKLDPRRYSGRTWTTRRRLWVDRVASAWLIRRFIDPKAKFLWLERMADRPRSSLGFDFDGADFTHVGAKVTFEVLLASFGLEGDAALSAIGRLVHFLDVGGVPVEEAAGLSSILSGFRALNEDDTAFLNAAAPLLDGLYAEYARKGEK